MLVETVTFQVCAFALAPLLVGVINKGKAAFAGRKGAPLLQPYFDIWKLLQKGAVYSKSSSWIFRAGPLVGLAAMATAMFLFPMGKAPALFSFDGDLIMFAGLLGLARFLMIVAALDTGSSFEGMGASREAMLSSLAEPAIYLGLSALVVMKGDLSLTDLIDGGATHLWNSGTVPALVLVVMCFFLVMLVENSRIPIDDPNTHLELTMIHEVMVLDHSGPDLAFISYTSALKLWLFASLIAGVALPISLGNVLADGGIFLALIFAVALVVVVIESSLARLRMQHTYQILVIAALLGTLAIAFTFAVR